MDPTSALIHAVSRMPVLYDINSTFYKDQQVRNTAWNNIANELKMSITDCQIKWSTLRRCLSNARKRQMRKREKGYDKPIKKWRYQDEMSFLLPFLDTKEWDYQGSRSNRIKRGGSRTLFLETKDGLTTVKHGDDSSEELMEEGGHRISYGWEESECTMNDGNPMEIKPSVEQLQLLVNNSSSDYYEHEETLSIIAEDQASHGEDNHIERFYRKRPSTTWIEEYDEMDAFFLSMAKAVKSLPKLEQLKVRSQVYNAVTNAEVNFAKFKNNTNDAEFDVDSNSQ